MQGKSNPHVQASIKQLSIKRDRQVRSFMQQAIAMSRSKNQSTPTAAPTLGDGQAEPSNVDDKIDDAAAAEGLPADERLMHAANKAEQALSAHRQAEGLKAKALALTRPAERRKMLQDAYNKEVLAHGHSKMAKRLQSGTVQGALGGAGIGGAVGAGVGTIVGTLVGGVVTLPTTAVGGLVGSGVGVIHGPFMKLGEGAKQNEKKTKKGKEGSEQAPPNDVQKDGEALTVPDPEGLKEAAEQLRKEKDETQDSESAAAAAAAKKKNPRRNLPPGNDGQPRRRPKKLEVR